jgi:CHAT domain-containing protein
VQTLAIIDLFASDERGRALDRSITSLRRLAALADHPAPVLADLSAALIVRAERTQAPRDLLEGYETAEQALRHEPRNLAALYNRALALERYGLVDETAKDWQAYLAVDSRSPWADDARRRLDALLHLPAPPAPPAADAPLPAYAAYAAADPQGARELGMDRLLGEWGDAVEAGDTARAADRLARAAALGEALRRRPGGDASLADMVRAIRASGGSATATRELARAHREYAAGRRHFDSMEFTHSERRFAAVAESSGGSPPLNQWSRLYLGLAWLQRGRPKEGERVLAEIVAGTEQSRYAALAARARWPLARTLGRQEQWEHALQEASEAARQFNRAGERENEGAALEVVADIRFVVGEPDSGYAALHRAIDRLRLYRRSLRLHNTLAASSDVIASDGLRRSALRLLGESVSVATRTRQPVIVAEARLRRARHLASAGDAISAAADLNAALALAETIGDTLARGWITAESRAAEAAVSLHTNPLRASNSLDSAAAYFARVPLPFRALPALVASAEARLSSGDAAGALLRLDAAVRLLHQRRNFIRMEPRRAAVFDAARAVVDRIVLLKLADGRPEEALNYMDGARASLATAGSPADGWQGGPVSFPRETALEFARIADTLLAWTVSAGRVGLARTRVDTVQLARTITDLEHKLERGAGEAEVRPALTLLYEWLIRPLEARVGEGVPLVVVADGEIAAVPFAALFDSRRGRYLVEDHPLRFSVSLAEAQRPRTGAPAADVLLVSDPAHDPREHPLLERLGHTWGEVGTIASTYPGAAILAGPDATRAAVEPAFTGAGIVHFAGHAVFDDQRPERSYLVLAPEAERRSAGKITAAELAQLDLRRVRLVVLSACRTVRSGNSRAGGFTGLAGALLAAGARATVGSTWDVDDRSTASLMIEFHRAYRTRSDGPRALRTAQLSLLRSSNETLRSPAAWAGFRYAGQ